MSSPDFQRNPFLVPFPYVKTSLRPPVVDPDQSPVVNVPISCYWIPYVAGALKVLLQQGTWQTGSDAELQLVLERAQLLEYIFNQAISSSACNGLFPPIACGYDFTESDQGWVAQVSGGLTLGFYDTSNGWTSVPFIDNPGQCERFLDIQKDFSATNPTITQVRVAGIRETLAGGAFNGVATVSMGVQTLFGNLPSGVGLFDVTLTGFAPDVQSVVIDLGTNVIGTGCGVAPQNLIAFVEIDGFSSVPTCP